MIFSFRHHIYLRGRGGSATRPLRSVRWGRRSCWFLIVSSPSFQSISIGWHILLLSTGSHLTVKVPPVFPSRPVTGSLQIVRSFYHDLRRLASLFVRSGQVFSWGRLGLSDVRPWSVILQDPGWGSCSGSHKEKGGPGPNGPGSKDALFTEKFQRT